MYLRPGWKLAVLGPTAPNHTSGNHFKKNSKMFRVEWAVAWNGAVRCDDLEKLHSDGVYTYIKRM
jgi:hypothetical protein